MEIHNFWVDIENASGVRLGAGPLCASFFDISSLLSASGEFSFEVSAADPNQSVLAEKLVAICRYVDRDGVLQVFGGGIIDKIVTTISGDGSTIVAVSGNDLGRELNYRSVGQLKLQKVEGIAGSPITLLVAVALYDTATLIAGKIRTALLANVPITDIYDVTGAETDIILTKKNKDANDPTLNIRISDDTCVGITLAAMSADTTPGDWGVTYQVETATVVGTITTAGNAQVIVTANGVGIFDGPKMIMALAPGEIIWTIRTSAEDNDWHSVCWSPDLSLFCAVAGSGTNNRVMTSPDGITWTIRTSAANNNWYSVCWSPDLSLFCAVAITGTGNRVMTSPDGITWTIQTSAANNNWLSVCWSPELSLFCAVAYSGTNNRVMTSPNGITWTIRTSAANNDWRSVCWSPELLLFCAVAGSGTDNRVMTSPNGITWTIRTSAADNDWRSVCWSPGLSLFCAVAITGTGNRVMTSPDGITWTIRKSPAENNWYSVCWSPELSLFCAVANSGTANRVMTSPDGITWTIRTSAADNYWRSVCWSPDLSLFCAVAYSGTDNRVMTSQETSEWTIEDGITSTPIYAGFDGESVLNALTRVGKAIGEHWRIEAGRVVQWLGPASTFSASGLRAVQHINDVVAIEAADEIVVISSLKEESDAADLITWVIPRGSGNGGAVTTLEFCTDAPPDGYTLNAAWNYLRHNAAEAAYGRIERPVNFKEIGPLSNSTLDIQAAANMLLTASVEYLRGNCAPQKFYDLSLGHVNQMLLPGTTIHVVYRELLDGAVVYDLNDDFIIVTSKNRIDAIGLHTTGIIISTIDRLPVSDNAFLAGQVQESRILSVHQQLGASVDTLTWRDEMDADHAANFRFWLGDEYTSIPRALFRFQIKPLRSTVKSVGSASATTSGGGSATLTSASGGSSSPTSESSAHTHEIWIHNGTAAYPVYVTADGDPYAGVSNPGVFFPTQHDDPAHTHSVSIPAHTHSVDIPNHTHTVTPVITTVYGIFEETGGNTLVLANLVIKLNGSSDLNSLVTDIGNGWYELDITDELTDVVFRPAQENNMIEISTATVKTARLEAQLTIRAVVQAVYYE